MPLIFYANDSTYTGPTTNITGNSSGLGANHTISFFILKALLKTAGWTVRASGDGAGGNYSANSDILTLGITPSTSSTTRANDFYNSEAWYYIQSPGTSSQHFTIQKSNNGYNDSGGGTRGAFRIKYSATGFWVSGSAGSAGLTGSATTTPQPIIASDEYIFVGGGSDSTPSYASITQTVNFITTKTQMAASNTDPYGFWFIAYAGLDAPNSNGCYLFLDPLASGSYGNQGSSPYVAGFLQTQAQLNQSSISQFATVSHIRKGLDNPSGLVIAPASVQQSNAGTTIPNFAGINRASGKVDMLPLVYMKSNNTGTPSTRGLNGVIGVSSYLRLPSIRMGNGETLTWRTKNDKICFGFLLFDWNGNLAAR